jgi:hypothetical protein
MPRALATQCKRHILYVEAPVMPFNGQTARKQNKTSTPLHSPLDFYAQRRSGISNGCSIRITSDHEILPKKQKENGDKKAGTLGERRAPATAHAPYIITFSRSLIGS